MTPGIDVAARVRRLILGMVILALLPAAGALRATHAERASCAFRALGHAGRGDFDRAHAFNLLWIPALIAMVAGG